MDCQERDKVVFHFNRAHLGDPSVPMWVVKHKGVTHYVHHMDVAPGVGFSTRETPDNPHTKGSLLIRGRLTIEESGGETLATVR